MIKMGKMSILGILLLCSMALATMNSDESGCYAISNADELYQFASLVNGKNGLGAKPKACGKLVKNIVVNKNVLVRGRLNGNIDVVFSLKEWTPIGNGATCFAGNFDGQGHSISGLYFSDENSENAGLFGCVKGSSQKKPAVIKNVGVEKSYIRGRFAGGIVANVFENVSLEKLYNASLIEGGIIAGGIVGSQYRDVTIKKSYNMGTVYGLGGLVGASSAKIMIMESYNAGAVISEDVGGSLIGRAYAHVAIEKSYDKGSVSCGDEWFGGCGGLVGSEFPGSSVDVVSMR